MLIANDVAFEDARRVLVELEAFSDAKRAFLENVKKNHTTEALAKLASACELGSD